MRKLLTGNEAIARGAYEHGVHFASAYPGTPSTEILENTAEYDEITAQWSPNEKVALEVGIGASIAGARVLVAMKHVGINVAADPLFTFSYTGVNGGLVLACADDPGMHSSQNEQDSRNYARFAKIPLLAPADSQEAKDMVGTALELSEEYDTPVILRSSTRISHAQGLVELKKRQKHPVREYEKNPRKYVMIPAYGRERHEVVEERLVELQRAAESHPANSIEWRSPEIGVITDGVSYQYVREALPEASCLKLGFTYPLPKKMIREFCAGVDAVYVVEELDPFIENAVRSMGINEITGKEVIPRTGELNPGIVASALDGEPSAEPQAADNDQGAEPDGDEELPLRPPVMCPGCPHRGVFYTLQKMDLTVTGDIGCYTLGSLPPLEAMDTCICMGASIGVALGMNKVDPGLAENAVAVIGDSTFFHSGITGIVDMVYNQNSATVMILDNRTTAMTGHQDHPGTGRTLQKESTTEIDITALIQSIGVDNVVTIDPSDLELVEKTVGEEVQKSGPSVIICKYPCALLEDHPGREPVTIDPEECAGCKICMGLGCPALIDREQFVAVNENLCVGCGLCGELCPQGIIQGGSL